MARTLILAVSLIGTQLTARADSIINHDSIREVVISHLSEVRACFDPFRKEHPGVEGRIYADFTIGDGGRVRRASANAAKSTLKDESVQTCVLGALRTWKFPEPHAGEEADVSYPFDLAK